MFSFLHTYHPSPIIFQIGNIIFFWYGLFIVLGIASGLFVALKLSKLYQIEKERIIDLSFWLIIFGIIGARLFDSLFYNGNYFFKHPFDILRVWQGGMSIHGVLIAGFIFLFFYCRKNKISFWFFADLFAPALILGQAIGRWGNYFNQELYGRPSLGIFSIPIDPINRVSGMENFNYFHPAFLYEFIGSLSIFLILIWLHQKRLKIIRKRRLPTVLEHIFGYCNSTVTENGKNGFIFLIYLILYSSLRFVIEFVRIDPQPVFLNLRLGQWISLLIIIFTLGIIIKEPLAFCLSKGHKT